ncbi:hypothetical protein BH09MYX1_BH09MYX1_19480 [soil metagenome]
MTHVQASYSKSPHGKSQRGIRLVFGAALLGAGLLASGVSGATPAQAAPVVGAQVAKGNNFTVEANIVGTCKAAAECKVDLKLTAGTGYHVNKEYPYKFKANDLAGVDFTGTDASGKNVFSNAAGDFRIEGKEDQPQIGYLTVHFKPAKAGAVSVTGTFKLSVCSAQNCQLETSELTIPVTAG